MAKNCTFQCKVTFDPKKQKFLIKEFCPHHFNHEFDQETYMHDSRGQKLTDAEVQKYGQMRIDMQVPIPTLKKIIYKETGKYLSTTNVHNLEKKFSPSIISSDMERTKSLLKERKISNPEDTVQIVYSVGDLNKCENPDEKYVKCFFYQSKQMKKIFEQHHQVLLLDGTYNLSNRGYVLFPFLAVDRHHSTREVAWAVVSNEERETLKVALQCFVDSVGETKAKEIQNVVIDKDYNQIAALTEILPAAEFVICGYHVMQAVGRHVKKMSLPSHLQEVKQIILCYFDKMRRAPSFDDYQEAWKEILDLTPKDPAIEKEVKYLDENWNIHREVWAFHHLKKKNLLGNLTNNRAENYEYVIRCTILYTKYVIIMSY